MLRRARRFKSRFRTKGRKRRKDYDYAKKIRIIFISVLVMCALVYLCFSIESHINPLMQDMALSNLNSLVIRECSEAVNSGDKLVYNDLINKTEGSDGEIRSLSVDYNKLNSYKANLTIDVQNRIDQINSVEVCIPFMAMFSSRFYSPIGFPVKLKVLTDENVKVEFEDKFESAGINQTRHVLSVIITVEMGVNLPMRASDEDIVTEIPIAETIIVGDVPTVSVVD